MYLRIKNWLKWKLAGDELKEFYAMKQRAKDVEVWCSHVTLVSETAKYINNPKDYPYQCFGPRGAIDDFRKYVEKLEVSSNE
jgi:hypothetical protein